MRNVNQKPENSCHTAIEFRKAVEADCEFCYLVRALAFREYAEPVRGWDEEHERALHRKRFTSQDFKVIQAEGHDVGVLSAETTPDAMKVFQLFILPEHQGRGIGSCVMEHLIREAAQLRLPLRLQVINGNDRALYFYKRHGFQQVGRTETHIQLERSSWGEVSHRIPPES